jgi:hypothetical protein
MYGGGLVVGTEGERAQDPELFFERPKKTEVFDMEKTFVFVVLNSPCYEAPKNAIRKIEGK